MNIMDDLFSENGSYARRLNEQIALRMSEILDDEGPVVIIMDKEGYFWVNNSEEFSKLGISESFLKEISGKIDDGDEPLVTQINDSSIISSQLATDKKNCGYVFVVFQHSSPESAIAHIEMVEMVLNQMNLIAKLIEKNTLLYELQMKQHQIYSRQGAGVN